MEISTLQIILICIYLAFWIVEQNGAQCFFLFSGEPIFNGLIVGLILGHPLIGLQIGATLQLMCLGVAEFGGASIPDYPIGAVVGTMVAVMTGRNDIAFITPFAVTVALLMSQLNILKYIISTFFIHCSSRAAEKLEMKKAYAWHLVGIIPRILKPLIPVILLGAIGADAVQNVINGMPDMLLGAFNTLGGMLPAVGLAILLKYMSTKRNIAFLITGFLLVTYLKIPILGVTLFGAVAALIAYKSGSNAAAAEMSGAGGNEDEG